MLICLPRESIAMNRRRRISILFLSVVLCFTLNGCSRANGPLDPDNPVHITIWHYYNGTQLAAFDRMIEEFNQTVGKERGVFVESFSQGGANDLARVVLDTANGVAGAGCLPDIFAAYPDTAYEVNLLGLATDLSPYLSENEYSEYVESFWEEGRLPPDGRLIIFPVAKSTELLLIDAIAWEKFLAANPAVSEKSLETWEGILEAAELYYRYTDALTPDTEGDGKAMFGVDSAANFILITLRQQGVALFQNEDGKGVLNLDENAIRRTFALYYEPVVRGWFAHVGRYRSDDVKTGEIIGYIGYSTGSSYFPDVITFADGSQQEAELAAYPMPTFSDGEKIAVQQGGGMVVAKSDEAHEYASVLFLKWLTEKEQNLRFALDSAYMPVKKDALFGGEMQSLLQEMEGSENYELRYAASVFQTVLAQLETHTLYHTAPFPGLFEARLALEDLADYANSARQDVLHRMGEGEPYEAAVSAALTDRAYQDWRDSFVKKTAGYFE